MEIEEKNYREQMQNQEHWYITIEYKCNQTYAVCIVWDPCKKSKYSKVN